MSHHSNHDRSRRQVRIALIQGREQGSASADLEYTVARIREAAASGAQIVCTQELFNTPYFCRTQDTALFDLAEPIPGATTEALEAVAKDLGVVIIASLFERRAAGVYHNTAAVIDADGRYLGKYRKMHIPQDPGFEEKFYFTPGDLGYKVWDTKFGKISVLICWDQWYPEAARLAALAGAEIIFYPTAIGWLPEEKAALGEAQHTAWETVQRGHAVANGCYVAAVNRTGSEGETEFWGQSFVSDFYGQIVERAPIAEEYILLADCDLKALEDMRRIWPFFRDRRIDTYADVTQRMIDE
ncbi:carbon-nitrogen hydrolase [Coraliomargarita sp. W4R53]